MKILVYTANFNNYDQIQYPVVDEGFEYLYFTDISVQSKRLWNFHFVNWKKINSDPKRATSYYKVGMNDLPDHDISVWIDSSMKFLKPLKPLIKKFVKSKVDMMACKHRWRNCVYEESQAVLNRKLDNREIIENQMKLYQSLGYPKNNGLIEGGFLIRKNNSKIQNFSKVWYNEYLKGSKRDQLSLNFSLSESNILFNYFPFKIHNNPYFKLKKHLKNEI